MLSSGCTCAGERHDKLFELRGGLGQLARFIRLFAERSDALEQIDQMHKAEEIVVFVHD